KQRSRQPTVERRRNNSARRHGDCQCSGKERELAMKCCSDNPLRDRPARLRALVMKGLVLLSALRRALERRPRRAFLHAPAMRPARATAQDPLRPDTDGGLFGHAPTCWCCTFARAQTFQDLFRQLDAKRIVWGSQKRYTAKELKTLINRARTKKPRLHLPLEVIPETGGLRRRVQALAAAEAAADDRENYRHAA